MPPGFVSSLRAYNLLSRNFHICLPPEDVVPTSAPRVQPTLSHPALRLPQEVIGKLCGMNPRCPYRDGSGAFPEVLSPRSQTPL